MSLLLLLYISFLWAVQDVQMRTFLPPTVYLLNSSDQVRASAFLSVCKSSTLSACPSVCLSYTSRLFTVSSTLYVDVYNTFSLSSESSHNSAASFHTIITLLNKFKLLPCKGLVNKSANIFFVWQCLILISPCFTLLATQRNMI